MVSPESSCYVFAHRFCEVFLSEESLSQTGDLSRPSAAEVKYKKLKGTPIDITQMPESAWTDESKADFIRLVGVRFGEFGRVHDFDTGGISLKRGDAVVVDDHEKGLQMGWVSKPPLRIDNSGLKLRLRYIERVATEEDLAQYEKQRSMQERGLERAIAAINRLRLAMTILRVEYTLDCRKATVYFSSDNRVDFRELLRDLVHDLKAKVELRQVGARDEARQIGAIGPCGEETCCSRFIDKFHGVSIKMAKDQNLSLKPTKVSGMCGRLKCCLAYEYQVYEEGQKTVPRIGNCVKCKSGGCGIVKDVDVPRQLVLVEMEDGNMAVLPATELVEDRTMRRSRGERDSEEKLVATTDTDALVQQIEDAAEVIAEETIGEDVVE